MNENFNKPEDRWGITADPYPSTDELLSEDSKKFLKTFETCHDALMDKVNEMAKLLFDAKNYGDGVVTEIENTFDKKALRKLLRMEKMIGPVNDYWSNKKFKGWEKKHYVGLKSRANDVYKKLHQSKDADEVIRLNAEHDSLSSDYSKKKFYGKDFMLDDKSGKQRVENRAAARGLKKKNNEL